MKLFELGKLWGGRRGGRGRPTGVRGAAPATVTEAAGPATGREGAPKTRLAASEFSGSHQIVLFTRVICFTPRLYDHTEVVRFHTRNEFIHTEMEQTTLYSIHITLHQIISYSKLPPLPHTNGTDTHEESGRNPHS